MITDAHFDIGRQHTVCEDHALSDPETGAVYLADGCSTARASDYGSRFLTLAAAQFFGLSDRYLPDDGHDHEAICVRARTMAETCGVPPECLMATLMYARHDEEEHVTRVVAWGDGVVAARRLTGFIEFHSIEFPGNAPTYPAYALDPERLRSYLDSTDDAYRIVYHYDEDGEHYPLASTGDGLTGFTPSTFEFPDDEYDLVVLMSDGASSFQRLENGAWVPVPLHLVVEQVMDFKVITPAFVTRRVRNGFLRRFCVENGWQHYDDFTVVGIYTGE